MSLNAFQDVPKLGRLSDYVFHWAKVDADGPAMALHGSGDRWTHVKFAADVNAHAKALIAAGVSLGDRVAIISAPNPQFSILFFAIISVGGIFVGLNPKYQRGELKHIVTDAAPKLLIGYREIDGRNYDDDLAALSAAVPSIAQTVMLDVASLREAFLASGEKISDEQRTLRQTAVRCRDACTIVYTSGSTGAPKGAVLHHQGAVETALAQLRSGMPRQLVESLFGM